MTNHYLNSQLILFKSLFKGREDVFAIRWEKGNKSGYMPAYYFDPYRYRAHKMKGGTFKDYPDKTYLAFSDEQLIKHLGGEQLIGVYPLLKDNTSWFLTADFDKENWIEQSRAFIKSCSEKNIPAYLERSRSGNGGHVWIFFESPVPAIKSRRIFISILEQSGIFSAFDKSSSFDRVFPNQDFLSGKGLGNLVALPLYKRTHEQGNSCFVDIDSMEAYKDQWEFLNSIKRISIAALEKLYQKTTGPSNSAQEITVQPSNNKLTIVLNKFVFINRPGINTALINFLKEELNFANSEFIIKKKTGRNTFGTERYFKFIEETENEVIIPKGFIGRIIHFCIDNKIEYDFKDERKRLPDISFNFNAPLREYQNVTIASAEKKDIGVIVAPPGSGKTIIGLKIISQKKQPALIIVHRKQLAEQWIERIETFLGIPKNEIGKIGQGKTKIGKCITIATIQSLVKELEKPGDPNITNAFGTIVVDECHHIPATTYNTAVAKLNSFFLYGLTATPFRKYNDGRLIFIHLGQVISEIKPLDIGPSKQAKIIICNTALDVPFNSKTDKFETLSKILIHDSARNKQILNDITNELNTGKKVVIITERKEHVDSLNQYLKQLYETITLSGEDTENNRVSKWKILKEGNYQVLITTGQFFGEGSDLQNAQCLFLVYPFSFEGKLIQYIGRVQRSEITPTIYDYRDIKIDYLNKLFLKRNTYYRKLIKQAALFNEVENVAPDSEKKTFTIEQTIKIPIEDLEFRYGSIAFKYIIKELNNELDFEIDNNEIRPEFEVLKPFFVKALQSKNVIAEIHAEFENNVLISQFAKSNHIERINRELIESIRFRFVTKNILCRKLSNIADGNFLDIMQLQSGNQLYGSAEELLQDILKHSLFKHHRQLRYLAEHHEMDTLKIRFVLSPFSFVFLLMGDEQLHIILETLDTEEATYLWHFDKTIATLPSYLKEIDKQLNIIRNQGRQSFLEASPENFSRIVHDYSSDQKGFIIWKDKLEESLV
ncbi:MAG: DEAD/DEAH box helicase family protein [Ferruginibacter sp.]